MGTVYAEITLKNVGDIVKAQNGYIPEEEVRAVNGTGDCRHRRGNPRYKRGDNAAIGAWGARPSQGNLYQ
jgi:hypothetical protein